VCESEGFFKNHKSSLKEFISRGIKVPPGHILVLGVRRFPLCRRFPLELAAFRFVATFRGVFSNP
tara:strand:- start:198 stop:392 length:195 start_codon:yes stop_codon:yes gene_type:complete